MMFRIERVMPVRLFCKEKSNQGERYARAKQKFADTNATKSVNDWIVLQRKMWRLEEIVGVLQHPGQTITVGGVEIPLDREAQLALSRVYARQLHDIRREFSDF